MLVFKKLNFFVSINFCVAALKVLLKKVKMFFNCKCQV